eukprot:291286-Karenia_brevis.AAC.1
MGANAVASTKQGRCPITAIAVAKSIRWDPWSMGPTNTIMHMLEIISTWDGKGMLANNGLDPNGTSCIHPTHGQEQKDQWGQPKCRWDG